MRAHVARLVQGVVPPREWVHSEHTAGIRVLEETIESVGEWHRVIHWRHTTHHTLS